jgi:hypothetical protein
LYSLSFLFSSSSDPSSQRATQPAASSTSTGGDCHVVASFAHQTPLSALPPFLTPVAGHRPDRHPMLPAADATVPPRHHRRPHRHHRRRSSDDPTPSSSMSAAHWNPAPHSNSEPNPNRHLRPPPRRLHPPPTPAAPTIEERVCELVVPRRIGHFLFEFPLNLGQFTN